MGCKYNPYLWVEEASQNKSGKNMQKNQMDKKPGWSYTNFQETKPTTKFYDNINRIQTLAEDGQLIQYSVYMTRDQRAAKAIRDLVHHYEGQVFTFKGEITEI